ncbi:hypothetical protein D9M69_553560 [compost metagenome]
MPAFENIHVGQGIVPEIGDAFVGSFAPVRVRHRNGLPVIFWRKGDIIPEFKVYSARTFKDKPV